MNRRHFLMSVAMGATALATLSRPTLARAAGKADSLTITRRTLEVKGKAASVFGLTGPSGKPGLFAEAGSTLAFDLVNKTQDETLIHWHGLTPPWELDGVPGNPAALLAPAERRAYRLPAGEGGTHWMHAHTLQEQELLAAPLIVRTAEDRAADEQEVVILLHDFSFRSPEELLADLRKGGSSHGMDMGMDHSNMSGSMSGSMSGMHDHHQMSSGSDGMAMDMSGMDMGQGMDINDIDYDAYLANDRTLDDPEVVRVEKGGRVRLRIINGATATAFTIDTGSLPGELIAVDGRPIVGVKGSRFPVTMGQRIDIRLQLSGGEGAFPVLALREGAPERTGIILATAGAAVVKIDGTGAEKGPILDLALEQQLKSLSPLAERKADRQFSAMLGGDMATYNWTIETDKPLEVKTGERIRIDLMNMSMMAHPVHLHGHHFQVVAINGSPIAGAVRDTVHMPPMSSLSIAFDALNPGHWPLHCHHLYHMASGMMTFVKSEA